jgi:hypothetical protein
LVAEPGGATAQDRSPAGTSLPLGASNGLRPASISRQRRSWPAKVKHLSRRVRPEHDVLRLDVAVDDPGCVGAAQGRRDLNGDVESLTQGEA